MLGDQEGKMTAYTEADCWSLEGKAVLRGGVCIERCVDEQEGRMMNINEITGSKERRDVWKYGEDQKISKDYYLSNRI